MLWKNGAAWTIEQKSESKRRQRKKPVEVQVRSENQLVIRVWHFEGRCSQGSKVKESQRRLRQSDSLKCLIKSGQYTGDHSDRQRFPNRQAKGRSKNKAASQYTQGTQGNNAGTLTQG